MLKNQTYPKIQISIRHTQNTKIFLQLHKTYCTLRKWTIGHFANIQSVKILSLPLLTCS